MEVYSVFFEIGLAFLQVIFEHTYEYKIYLFYSTNKMHKWWDNKFVTGIS